MTIRFHNEVSITPEEELYEERAKHARTRSKSARRRTALKQAMHTIIKLKYELQLRENEVEFWKYKAMSARKQK